MIFLSASTDAVDACGLTKDIAVKKFCEENNINPSRVAGIGDSSNDIPFLSIPGLGLAGAPLNAQPAVKTFLRQKENSFLSSKICWSGFKEFYQKCISRQITHVFADRDGVLICKDPETRKDDLRDLFLKMGQNDRPFVIVLTGSSYEQNIPFLDSYTLDGSLSANSAVVANPYLIYAENGAVQINVLDKRIRNFGDFLDPELIKTLTRDFAEEVTKRIEENVLESFALCLTLNRSDEVSKIYIPKKSTMVTFNIPKEHAGYSDYRRTVDSDQLRKAILQEMVFVAEKFKLPYKVLE